MKKKSFYAAFYVFLISLLVVFGVPSCNNANNKLVIVNCPGTESQTFKDVCDTSEATAKKKTIEIFQSSFQCPANCKNYSYDATAVAKGTCLFNRESGRMGTLYDITVTLICRN
jgi:hypothetical protein